ncbi:MAG: hypothetical protein GY725_14495 [bacterium]|nr:hypothetical protein [bacterium]
MHRPDREALERVVVSRPMDSARTILAISRAFGLERLTHPRTKPEDLRRRLAPLFSGLFGGEDNRMAEGEDR